MIQLKRILVPVDFSECAELALQYAVSFASQYSAEVHLLHVLEEEFIPPVPMEIPIPLPIDNTPQRQQDIHERLRAMVAVEGSNFTLITSVRGGKVSSTIIEYASEQDIDIIIMGARGSSGFIKALLGDISYAVSRYAKCPVLTVRPTEHLAQEPHQS